MSENNKKTQMKLHLAGCDTADRLGVCNCNPAIVSIDQIASMETDGCSLGDGILICGICGQRSCGEINRKIVEDTTRNYHWELFWAKGDDLFYWAMEQDESDAFCCQDCALRDGNVSADQICEQTGWDLTKVYQMARSGEIPGALWGATLTFKPDELNKWWPSFIEATLRGLEEKGLVTSYVDLDGQRRYIHPKFVH